ncbi:MAG: methyltransferase [Blastocatellia bacterium]|nr:methyltransferase [Blastocatellia bacterium]
MTFVWNESHFFKNWAKPGPWVSPLDNPDLQPNSDETLDALCGHYRIFQLSKGHRYSTDDLLTAWYGTAWCPSARNVLDLGSGTGSVGMSVAWKLQGVRVVAIEAQEISVQLAHKSVKFNGLENRYEIRHGDLRDPAILSKDEKFDLILGSPPYFPMDAGIHGAHPQKIACRFELRGSIIDYCKVASEHLDWGGMFACIFPFLPDHQAKRVINAAKEAGLTIVRQRPIIFKEGDLPLLSVFAMVRSDHLPESFRNQTWQEPPLIIRTLSGDTHPEYSAVALTMGLPPC